MSYATCKRCGRRQNAIDVGEVNCAQCFDDDLYDDFDISEED